MTVLKMDVDGLDNPERAKLLSVVDEFRALGLSKEISLPQLVVVGDQSSGKSSLLEGLTGLSFPTDNGLCTRFATQIILRRSDQIQAKVSILPGHSASQNPDKKRALELFNPLIGEEGLVGSKLTEILDEAAVAMGLPPSTQKATENLEKRFSDDVLSIELSGPEHRHLSVVDVPGLFHSPTPSQTQEDLDTIRALIEGYMENERTIVLTVMDALNNLANQEVFSLAKKHDQGGKRTVGVITKCDALGAGDEDLVIDIAQNKSILLHHGWFAVRNRSTREIQQGVTIKQRHEKEEHFFKTAPWSSLSKSRTGISAMRTYLAQLLYDHIRSEFPQLVDDIRSKALETRQHIAGLGDSRTTPSEQRHYLTRIAHEYQTGNTEAIRGTYSTILDPNDPRRLRMHIALENDKLASRIHNRGHLHQFEKVDSVDQKPVSAKNLISANNLVSANVQTAFIDSGRKVSVLPKRATNTPEPAESGILSDQGKQGNAKLREASIYSWIRGRYRMSRGAELAGTVNPAVLEGLFGEQALPWGPIAKEYLDTVNMMVIRHIDWSCMELIPDKSTRRKINERNKRAVSKARDFAIAELDQISEDEMGGILQTTNHYFAENLAKNRQARYALRLKEYIEPRQRTSECGTPYMLAFDPDDMVKKTYLSNEDSAVYDIHDILKAYYKVAMKRFVDTVVLQVAERHFLGSNGPLKFFSPAYVGGLSDEELNSLAGENEATSMERERLKTLLSQLERALKLGEAVQ